MEKETIIEDKTIYSLEAVCNNEVFYAKQLQVLEVLKGMPTGSAKSVLKSVADCLDNLSVISVAS